MCGIAMARDQEVVRGMLWRQEHRGSSMPQVKKAAGGWWVGFRRLPIVGEEDGRQPYRDPINGSVTVFNGELYNVDALRVSLSGQGVRSEVHALAKVMHQHRQWVRVVDGEYAAVHVTSDGVVVGRDLCGVVPLSLAWSGKRLLAVASERKAFAELTVPHRVQDVRAGTVMRFGLNGRLQWAWKFDPWSLHVGDVDYEHLEKLFRKAVARRVLHVDEGVGVAVALSGGVDSTMVAKVVAETLPKMRVEAITVGTDENAKEVQAARMTAEALRMDWKFVKVTQTMVDNDAEKLLGAMDGEAIWKNPIKWRGLLRNFYVAKAAKATVILCGEGADEVGAGYPSHARALRSGTGLDLEWKSLSTVRSMPSINLDRTNKGGMAWTKEYRVPFLDREFALYLMGCQRLPGKVVLRELAKRMGVPDGIAMTNKYSVEEDRLEGLVATWCGESLQ